MWRRRTPGITEFTNEALSGKVIGAQSGTTQAEYVQTAYPDADIRLYPTQDEVNLDLASGRLDLQVGDIFPLLGWVNDTEDGACCELIGEPITDPKFVGEGVGIAVRQEDNELREKLNAALKPKSARTAPTRRSTTSTSRSTSTP